MEDALKRIYFAPSLTVCVDSTEDDVMRGRFYSAHFAEPFEFLGMTDMLLQMNGLFDELEFPRMSCELRSISREKKREKAVEKPLQFRDRCCTVRQLDDFRGERLTFFIQVFFRQNATWQGEIRWLEGHRTERFRSVLELIELMTEAIKERGNNE